MTDVLAMTTRVFRLSTAYRALAGKLLARAQALHRSGELDDDALAAVRRSSNDLILKASDMLVELDDALAQALSAPLAQVEQATGALKTAEKRIAAVTDILSATLGIAAAAAAVAVFIGAPGSSTATAAVQAIASAVKTVS